MLTTNCTLPLPAEVAVERVVGEAGEQEVLGVGRAAEELDAVVLVHVDLEVIDDGAVTDAAQGETVDLLVDLDLEAAELEADEANHA